MNKKDFEPILLKGGQSKWFVNYLEGKIEKNTRLEKKREKVLKKASEVENYESVCL